MVKVVMQAIHTTVIKCPKNINASSLASLQFNCLHINYDGHFSI